MIMESINSLDFEEIVSINCDSSNQIEDNRDKHNKHNIEKIFTNLIQMAAKCIQSNDYNTAIRLYSEALKLDQSNHIVYGNRSAIYCRLGCYEKALHDAIKARELCPGWSKAYYRQGIALQFLRRYPDALAAFGSGLAQESKSVQLLTAFVETALKSPLRATLEPIYRQLQMMDFDKSPFVITSVVGQELLAGQHYAAAVVVLESALRIGSCSLKLRGSVYSALSTAYWSLNNLDQAINYMQKDLQVSRALGDILGECRVHANLGSAYFAKCSYKEALASHRYQLVLAMKHKHNEQAALALTSLGHVYSAIGDLKNALSSHRQCLQIIRQSGVGGGGGQNDPLAEAKEIGNIGTVHLAAGEFDKAIECHLEHVKLAKLLSNKLEEAKAYLNLGSAYHGCRQYEQAIQYNEQVLRLSQEIGDKSIESKAYAGLGHASRCMKDYIQAKRWYERQLDVALTSKNRSSEAKACSNLGIVYQLLGDYDGALKLHFSHLNICKQMMNDAGIVRAYGNIGNTYLQMKQPDEAHKYHRMELKLAKDQNDRISESNAHGSLAICCQSLSMMDQALSHLNQQLNLAREIDDANIEAQALCNLGNFHKLNGCPEKALNFYENFLQIMTSIGDKEGEAKAFHLLGTTYYQLKQYDQALKYHQFDLDRSKKLQQLEQICRAYRHLGLLHKTLNNLDDALDCYQKYLSLTNDNQNEKLKIMGYVGDILAQQGKQMDAIKILQKLLQLSRSNNDINNEVMALKLLGNCYQQFNDYKLARDYFRQELIIRQCLNDINEQICCLNDLGECYLKSNELELALKYFLEQLDRCEKYQNSNLIINDEYDSNGYSIGSRRRSTRSKSNSNSNDKQLQCCKLLSQALHNIAITKFNMNQFEESAQYYERQSMLIQKTLDNNDIDDDEIRNNLLIENINCLRSIGDCYFAQRRYDEAIKYYLDFLSSPSLNKLMDQEQVYCLLGKCYQLVNNLQQALVSYEKRLVIAHELGCDQTKALAYGELGHLHRLLSNYEQAITCFKHEQELGKKSNHLLIEAEALHGLGCVAQEMHDYERSLKYHSSALSIAQEIGSLQMESRAYGAIGSAYNALGNYESAIQYQEKYLVVAQSIDDLNAQVTALSALGKIHSSNCNYPQARTYFQQALAIVENQRIGYRDEEEARICYELGMVLWAMNELTVAEIHLRRSVDLIENLQNLNSSITHLMMIEPMMMNYSNSLIKFSNKITPLTTKITTSGGSSQSDVSSTTSSTSHYEQIRLQQQNLMIPTTTSTQPQSHHHYLHYQGASYEALIKILIALQRPTEALLIAERSRTLSFSKTKHQPQGFNCEYSITTVEQIIDMARSKNAAILYYSMTIDGSYNSWLITPDHVHFSSSFGQSDGEKLLQLIKNVQNSLFINESNNRLINSTNDNDDYSCDPSIDRSTTTSSLYHLRRNHLLNSSNYSLSSLFSLASTVTTTSEASATRIQHRSRHSSSSNNLLEQKSSIDYSGSCPSNIHSQQQQSNSKKIKQSFTNNNLNKNWQADAASALYEILIEPFQNELDQTKNLNQLLLVLDGDLFLVPWNMLRNKQQEFLSERYSLLVIPSLHVLRGDQHVKSHSNDSTLTSLVVANPTMPNKLSTTIRSSSANYRSPPLYFENPASNKEAAFVSELLSTRPLIGTEANKEAVLAQLSVAQCVHFSSYIIDNTDGDPLKMATGLGIAISPSDVLIGDSAHQLHDHEYLLTPHDLISIGLSSKLVVISCPAISSRSTMHAGSLNAAITYNSSQVLKMITSALLQAGAACVLLTLWPVSLSALQVLFRIFYCSLLQGTRVSTALKEAVSTIQNTTHFSHPKNWAGFILIGSDVRLSSQVALISSSLATLIKTPEKSRDAMRVVLHLVEKSLQRIQRGQKNAMYTTVQSIDNKVGINTQGWRELLIAVGFRFEPASTNGGSLPACVFFPQSDPNGRLLRCSNALQAILALSPATIAAVSKLITNSTEYVGDIIEKLDHIIQYSQYNHDLVSQSSSSLLLLASYLETLSLKLWSTPGCHELYASLGFDLMEVGADSVTLRAGKNANIRTIMFTLRSLKALFENCETINNVKSNQKHQRVNHQNDSKIKSTELSMMMNKKSNRIEEKKSTLNQIINCVNPIKSIESIIVAESSPASRGFSIGHNESDAELIEMKLKSMPNVQQIEQSIKEINSSQSSIATSNTTVLNYN